MKPASEETRPNLLFASQVEKIRSETSPWRCGELMKRKGGQVVEADLKDKAVVVGWSSCRGRALRNLHHQ